MQKFIRHFVIPLAKNRGWKKLCEIGALTGQSTDEILKLPNISHTIIDPCFDADLALKYAGDARVMVQKGNSLDVLPRLTDTYDCLIIDGDHNWYTVMNELDQIRQRALLRPGGVIFFHDVEWPYARRDMYYQPETIPHEYRQEYERRGIIRGRSELADTGGTNSEYCNAVREGGPRNGVLQAIEDFIAKHPSDYRFCRVKLQRGLGILQYRQKRLSDDIRFLSIQFKAWLYSLYRLRHHCYPGFLFSQKEN
jgi:predicted O-methyltransferase YrrM